MLKVAVAIRPATLLRFHRALVRRKYQWLFSSKTRRRPGPKGPSKELIAAILEIKRLNPRFGCPRIAQQISHAFGFKIDKDVVRRILVNHPVPKSGGDGPSWLSALAEACISSQSASPPRHWPSPASGICRLSRDVSPLADTARIHRDSTRRNLSVPTE
jgi:hypothetical protein